MDNEIKKAYDRGIRAYYRDGDCQFINQFGEQTVWSSLDDWIALRAYQDAERKKGVPIILSYTQKSEWCGRDYNEFVFLLKSDDSPVIAVGSATEGYDWSRGEFTNFRWRAGYPKGGQNGSNS